MIAKGAQLKDRYRLERLLGRGGMASVWLASDQVLERPVAVKLLSDTIASDPEFLARFRREARVAAGLSHPNLIGVYDYADGAERPYLVMEYVPGDNLAERMSQNAAIDCERLARELLGALAHIHAAGIVHRDVKPQNVLVAPDGSAKLIDFGIALPKDATALTRTGNLLGTARYIAPEVMSGKPATERSDLYSCGVVLRDCIGDNPSRQLRALVERLSTADPGGRPASAQEALARVNRRAAIPDRRTERLTQRAERPLDRSRRLRPASDRRAASIPDQPTEPFRPVLDDSESEPGARRSAWGRAAAIVATVAALAVGFLVVADGPEEKRGGATGSSGTAGSREEVDAPERTETDAAAAVPAPSGSDPALGSTLNQEGFELIQAGLYEEAIPVLEEAVRAFPPGTEDLNYAYALYNLGNALRLGGRPEEAIPVLERRLEIPNQTEVVRRELVAARRAATS